ncbi:N-acetylmuramoyl-L-alanine amidase [Niveibacterium sp. 24ML]|uniref:N-acetylmuramoyl-L-alanine amidase n=1 Tax=Niveibacterium sp. 24ML TaxID=2985512 RepID=UPI002270CB86|nr:N-acetylmuramoyl-L-alanine amidase [Niveibacterium sp. 24ML]MCX9156325.1 N-acetylmuramoyl-L-alanine amidase [Niveibacterium sp. 24ML]
MDIKNHWLTGERIRKQETPNRGGALKPRFLVMHFTGGASAQSSADWLCNPAARASAHLVLARDGSIIQLAPFNVVTWHAGVSQWNGVVGLNQHSIGIEMDNAGGLRKAGTIYQTTFGRSVAPEDVVVAAHKHGGPAGPWHAYTAAQIERAFELAELLVSRYGLEDILGHEDIARGRKTDPGPAFPLEALRARAHGRADDAPPHYQVTASSLNIRAGAGAEFPAVAPALKKGTKLVLLEAGDRWNRVEVVGNTDIEGWVNNQYIEAIKPSALRALAPKAGAKRAAPKAATKAATKAAPKSSLKAAPKSAPKSAPKAAPKAAAGKSPAAKAKKRG